MRKMYAFINCALSFFFLNSAVHAGHVYVRSSASAGGDGKSWETAFDSIDAALANLQDHPDDTTFWVAAGVYSPITPYSPSGVKGGAAGGDFPTGLYTFDLPDGVKIYGGFKGDEACLSDRCTVPNPVCAVVGKFHIHSNPPGQVVDFNLTVLDGTVSESWHVVTVGNDIAKTGANVGLFDLTIRGGYADGPDSGSIDAQFNIVTIDYAHDSGGGIYARYGSSVDLFNVRFMNHASSGANATVKGNLDEPILSGGGGIAGFDEGTHIHVKNSYFSYNSSVVFGGAGGAVSTEFDANLNVSDCLFTDNTANRTGGAIRSRQTGETRVSNSYFERNIASDLNVFLDESGGAIDTFQGNLFVDNSIFIRNEALISSGAIFFHTFLDDGEAYFLDVNNCCFESNVAGPFGGGGILIFGGGQHVGSKATIRHSTFVGNRGGLGGAIYTSSFDTDICDNCFKKNTADAWGGAIAVDNLGDAVFFPPLAYPQRLVAKIQDCLFEEKSVRGIQPIPMGYPPFFTPPAFLNLFVSIAPLASGINTSGTVDQTIEPGGGAIAVLLAGVAKIKDCLFKENRALEGTGGAILVGGATGTVTDLDTGMTYRTLDYATAFVKKCKFKSNRPNQAKAVDLAGVGKGPDGVNLIIEK